MESKRTSSLTRERMIGRMTLNKLGRKAQVQASPGEDLDVRDSAQVQETLSRQRKERTHLDDGQSQQRQSNMIKWLKTRQSW